jgi:uncharacterized protein (DUF362 family)
MSVKVSLVQSLNHYDGVQGSLDLLREELEQALARIPQILLKVNLVVTRVPLSHTPIDAVRAFIDFVKPFYDGEIIIAESATWGKTKDAFDQYGYSELAAKHDLVSLLDLRDDETVDREITYAEGEVIVPFSKTMVETPFLVSIVRPKTHVNAVVTLGLKNVLVGVIQKENAKGASTWSTRNKIHREKSRHIHDFLLSLGQHISPHFTVIDGTIGMEGNGPVKGTEIDSGWVISSFDALAADTLGAFLMDFPVHSIPYLNGMHGMKHPADEIYIIGANPTELVRAFEPHRSLKHLKTQQISRQQSS